MRDQYKVLQETYELVHENVPEKSYEELLERFIEMTRSEDKDVFFKFCKENRFQIYLFNRHTGQIVEIHPELTKLIERTFNPSKSSRTTANALNDPYTDRLYRAIYWCGHLITFRKNRNEVYSIKNARKDFEDAFYEWSAYASEYKALKAAQTQHTSTHGVDLGDL